MKVHTHLRKLRLIDCWRYLLDMRAYKSAVFVAQKVQRFTFCRPCRSKLVRIRSQKYPLSLFRTCMYDLHAHENPRDWVELIAHDSVEHVSLYAGSELHLQPH